MNSFLMFLFGGTCGILIAIGVNKITAKRKKQAILNAINSVLDSLIDKVSDAEESDKDTSDFSGKVADENTVVNLGEILSNIKDSDFLK